MIGTAVRAIADFGQRDNVPAAIVIVAYLGDESSCSI